MHLSSTGNPPRAGEPIQFEYTLSNLGNVTVENATVVDQLLGSLSLIDSSQNGAGTLAPGESETAGSSYEVTQADIDQGVVHLSGTATGFSPLGVSVSDPASRSVPLDQNPSFSLDMGANRSDVDQAGQPILYTITLQNTGNQTLTDVSIDHTLLGSLSEPEGDDDDDSKLDVHPGPVRLRDQGGGCPVG